MQHFYANQLFFINLINFTHSAHKVNTIHTFISRTFQILSRRQIQKKWKSFTEADVKRYQNLPPTSILSLTGAADLAVIGLFVFLNRSFQTGRNFWLFLTNIILLDVHKVGAARKAQNVFRGPFFGTFSPEKNFNSKHFKYIFSRIEVGGGNRKRILNRSSNFFIYI